jgi:hypothetical protein
VATGPLARPGPPAASLPSLRVGGETSRADLAAPMVLTDIGAKLSKSLIREGKVVPPPGTHDWMLDVTGWPGSIDDYVDALVWLVGRMLADPKHSTAPAPPPNWTAS